MAAGPSNRSRDLREQERTMDEAAKPRYLAGRLRHSLAQSGARKLVAAKGHGRLLNHEGRDADLFLPKGDKL
jgi:hypothetical protein